MSNEHLSPEELAAIQPSRRGRPPANRVEAARNTPRQDRVVERDSDRQPDRIPVHLQNRDSLDVHSATPGFHGHWVLDLPGRIDKMLRAGYRFKTKDGHPYSSSIPENGTDSRISKPGGGGVLLYFMEIPQELYEQDQAAKNQIAKDQLASVLPHDPGFYSRDKHGREIDASEAARVETRNSAY